MFGLAVDNILRNANSSYKTMLEMNVDHPDIKGCKLGAQFSHRGKYYVFTGVNGRNRKFPCMATNIETRKAVKFPRSGFDKVRKASEGMD